MSDVITHSPEAEFHNDLMIAMIKADEADLFDRNTPEGRNQFKDALEILLAAAPSYTVSDYAGMIEVRVWWT